MPIAVRQAIASASSPRANRFMKGGSNVSRAPPKPSGPWVPSPAAGTPQPAPPCSQRPSFPSESRRVTRSLAPPPAAISARSPGLRSGALSIVVVSHSSAATRSASGYPTSTRTRGPAPTPGRPLWRTKAGPADIPIQGCGAVAINTASISIESTSTARREDEGVGDEDLAAALRNREPPRLDLRSDAALDRPIVQGALLRVRLGHRPGRIDGPGRDQLAREVRPGGELRLVAVPDLGPVVVHDLADQLGVDRSHHFGLAWSQADLAVLLAAQAAFSVAVAGEAAADTVGADPCQAEARPVAAAAPATQRFEAHARIAARFADLGAGQVAHRVAGALLQGDSEDVALAVAAAQSLEQTGLRHQCPVVHLALGARVPAWGRLAAGFTFCASSTRVSSRLGGAARTTSGRGLISSGSPAAIFGGGTTALQNFIPVIMRIAAMLATSTPFQSVCSPPTRAAPGTLRIRRARLPLESTATDRCGSGTTRPCASAWLRPRTSSSGPPRTRPSSSRRSCRGRGAATIQPFTSLFSTLARPAPCRSAWHPEALPAWNCSPGWSCQTLTRVLPQKSSTSAHSPPSGVVIGGRASRGAGFAGSVRTARVAGSMAGATASGAGSGAARGSGAGGAGGASASMGTISSCRPWSVQASSCAGASSSRTTCSAGACGFGRSTRGSSSPWMSCSRGRDFWPPEGSTDRAWSSTMTRRSPMEMRSPCRNGAARTGWPFRYRGAAVVARRTTPSAPHSMTACVGATVGESSTRSAVALPRRIRSA